MTASPPSTKLSKRTAAALLAEMKRLEAAGDTDAGLSIRWRLAMSARSYVRARVRERLENSYHSDAIEDVTQHVLLDLVELMHTWRPADGKLTTWARWRVLYALQRAPDVDSDLTGQNHGRVYVPKAREMLASGMTVEEVAEALPFKVSARTLTLYLTSYDPASRLDAPLIRPDGAVSRLCGRELLADPTPGQDDQLEAAQRAVRERQALEEAVAALPGDQRVVITARWGLDGSDPVSLAEVGRRLQLTRARIQQIEMDALKAITDTLGVKLDPVAIRTARRARTAHVQVLSRLRGIKPRLQRYDAPEGRCAIVLMEGRACLRAAGGDRPTCTAHTRYLKRRHLDLSELPQATLPLTPAAGPTP